MVLHLYQKVSRLYVFEDKICYKRVPIIYKIEVQLVDTLSRRTYFWNTAVPGGSENSHKIVQLNPDEVKDYPLIPYPTLMQPLKKFSAELELLPAIPILSYNQSAYTLNQTFKITFEHNIFKNCSLKWTKSNDNP